MRKHSLLIASCFLFSTQLRADPIQTLTITSLTASQQAPPNGMVQFTASGPSVFLFGSGGIVGHELFLTIGSPIGHVSIALPPFSSVPYVLNGILTTTTPETTLQLEGVGPVISGTTSLLVPRSGNVSFPGTVKGEYAAFACGLTQFPPHCTGPQIANTPIDLPGLITLSFSPWFFGQSLLDSGSFTSIPEPSSVILSLLSAVTLAVGLIARRKKIAQVDQ